MTEHCCEVWPKICGHFHYFGFADGSKPDVRIMPYIPHTDGKWRVNYCPSCGAEIRSKDFDVADIDESLRGLT